MKEGHGRPRTLRRPIRFGAAEVGDFVNIARRNLDVVASPKATMEKTIPSTGATGERRVGGPGGAAAHPLRLQSASPHRPPKLAMFGFSRGPRRRRRRGCRTIRQARHRYYAAHGERPIRRIKKQWATWGSFASAIAAGSPRAWRQGARAISKRRRFRLRYFFFSQVVVDRSPRCSDSVRCRLDAAFEKRTEAESIGQDGGRFGRPILGISKWPRRAPAARAHSVYGRLPPPAKHNDSRRGHCQERPKCLPDA